MFEKSCCICQNKESKQELTQDRLDVDVVHRCLEVEEYYYLDEDYGKTSDCQSFELHDELKNTAPYQLEKIKEILRGLNFWELALVIGFFYIIYLVICIFILHFLGVSL
ncbi:MAG: hypothetical protein A4E26_01743 [Methanobacterium sp. PtaU1.Bin097]|nr:MAG: hypothetical protein A4E26_01743 [Methanobacterium sp. PtaU1.Bin097]